MTKEEIIESGLLELYVLGKCDTDEMRIINSVLAKNPDLNSEIRSIENSLIQYAEINGVTLNPEEKIKIENKIFDTKETENSKIIPFGFSAFGAAASFIIISMLALLSLFYYNKSIGLQKELSILSKNNQTLTFQNLINKANYRNASEQLSLIHKHGNKTTHLEGLPLAPKTSAMVYWNSENKQLYINIDHLPKLESGKQYQLWALEKGKTIDAGVVPLLAADNTIYKMKNIQNADSFAISIEKVGGAASPTADQIIALGKI